MNQPLKPLWIRLLKLLLLFGVTIYLVVCIAIAVSQRSLIYHPQVFSAAEVDQKAQIAKLERWTNSTGQFIGFKRPSPKQPVEGTILFLYGNGSTATGSAHYADDIQRAAPLDVFILEYPGYEDRDGEPTEKNLFAAATEALQTLPTNLPIYLIGESLGSGVASYLAGTYPNKISGLILNFSVQPVDQCRAKSLSNFAGLVIAYGSFPFGKISTQFSRQSWNHD